jgi:GH15 family glucan-1,4-alpha-glucosidase
MLGNFPQTFVHAAFIAAVIGLETGLEQDKAGKVKISD